ncbi:ABC transporter type 1 superfamily protein [Penicillium ucsense]|uniref:ABC transporter type 1 superfamily protein n=1 Tax=Penicillium ucsense TaxID=2839758 RepID=A0A8J8W7Y5_9EURO|nr:ABC transporter type 1 superfamily protein [Penicillium ucsense]KAF7737991.1 ABC transporter type 1 superfamily protein [Penicillium ucsense]
MRGCGVQKVHLSSAPLSNFSTFGAGAILNRLAQDVQLVDEHLSLAFANLRNLLCFTDLESKSQFCTILIDMLDDLATIPTFGWQAKVRSDSIERLGISQNPAYFLTCSRRLLKSNVVLDLSIASIAISSMFLTWLTKGSMVVRQMPGGYCPQTRVLRDIDMTVSANLEGITLSECFIAVPRDPFILSRASVQFNLDPHRDYGDDLILKGLEKTGLCRWSANLISQLQCHSPRSADHILFHGTSTSDFLSQFMSSFWSGSRDQIQIRAQPQDHLREAVIHNRKPIAILDEADSSLDRGKAETMQGLVKDIFMNQLHRHLHCTQNQQGAGC